jgi:putative membrane protein
MSLLKDPSLFKTVEDRLRAVEGSTGVQIVVATLGRADVYHGLRWRAFAFGAAASGIVAALGGTLRPGLMPDPAAFSAVAAVLGTGLLCALAATLSPPIARLFLEPLRAEAEVRQRAAVIFLGRELFATRDRTAVLLLACDFERRAVVLGDSGFRGRVTDDEWRSVGEMVSAQLRAGRQVGGLIAGLEALELLLTRKGFAARAGSTNEIPDRPVTGTGPP